MIGKGLHQFLLHQPVLVMLVVGLPVFLANYFAGNPGISGWDPNFYFAYAGALADGGTLELDRAFEAALARGVDPVAFDLKNRTATGQLVNVYPLGHPLLHTPATFVGSLVAIVTEGSRNAFGTTAQLFYCVSALLGAGVGIEATRRSLVPVFGHEACALAVYTTTGCTMLGYYWFVLPAHSHSSSVLVTGLAFAVLVRLLTNPAECLRWYAALGALLGWCVLVRLQDLGCGFLALAALWGIMAAPGLTVSGRVARALSLVGAGLGVVSIQLLHWKWKDGTWFMQSHNAPFDFTTSNHWNVLFSVRHGLFLWHPAMLLALVGVVVALGASSVATRALRGALWAGLLHGAGILLIGGFFTIWWFGDSFGSRPFLSATPVVIAGLAMLWHRARERSEELLLGVVVGTLAMTNAALALAFHLGWISRN